MPSIQNDGYVRLVTVLFRVRKLPRNNFQTPRCCGHNHGAPHAFHFGPETRLQANVHSGRGGCPRAHVHLGPGAVWIAGVGSRRLMTGTYLYVKASIGMQLIS